MSHIPTSAMPHAGRPADAKPKSKKKEGKSLSKRAADLADKARDNPKIAIAAGAAVVAGIAAAAIPLVISRTKSEASGTRKRPTKSSGSKTSGDA